MAKLKASEAAGWNAGKNLYTKPMKVADIKTDPEIAALFDYQDKMVDEVCRSILKDGYHKEEPISVWNDTVVDGHTRLAAAKKAGLEEIPVVKVEFKDKEEAILYTFERQIIRRNLTASEILTATQMLGRGRKAKDGTGRAAELLANRLGVSAAHIYQVQKILREATEEEIESVRREEKSVKEIYTALCKPKKETAAKADGVTAGAEEGAKAGKGWEQSLSSRMYLLQSAVTLLAEAKEGKAARLLVNHFFRKNERKAFLELLGENIRSVVDEVHDV